MSAKKLELSPNEVMRRTTILRRFRELLKAQRDRFRAYLDVLEKQKDTIEKGSADGLVHYVELEERIVADIFSIQKVINPLEEFYHSVRQRNPAAPGTFQSPAFDENDDTENENIMDLKTALEGLKAEAVSRSKRNKALLSRRMAELRLEIQSLRSNPYRPHSAFSDSGAPSLIDLVG